MSSKSYGRYKVEELLGAGGMATVFRAYDPMFGRQVALKVLPRELLDDAQSRARFEREARTIAGLEHAAIVPVYDFGEEDGVPYLVMRLMLGGSLRDRILKGPIPPADALHIIERVSGALGAAHRRRIVHRDLKPENILFDKDDRAYLADFGIVKLARSEATSLTVVGGMVGTPAYMSPEQVMSREDVEIDSRSDVYSLGILVYEMLTGRLPYYSNTPLGMAMMHVMEPTPRLPDHLLTRLPGCQEVLNRALAKDPKDRFVDALAFSSAMKGPLGAARQVTSVSAGQETVIERPPPAGSKSQSTLDRLYREAGVAMAGQDWDAAIVHLNDVLAIDPSFRDTVGLLSLANRQKRTAKMLSEAQAALAAEDWNRAMELAAEVTASDVRRPEAEAILEEARVQQDLAANYRQAQAAISGRDWMRAIGLLEAIQTVNAGFRDVNRLMEEASSGLQEERRASHQQYEAEERAKGLLLAAEVASSEGDWTQAVALLDDAARLQPANPVLQSKLIDARRQLQISRLLEHAEQAMAGKGWNEAILAWDRLLALAPLHERAKEGLRQAEEARDQESRQAEVAEWVRQAGIHEGAEQWTAALAAWNQALTLSPDDKELLRRRDEVLRHQKEAARAAELEALGEQAAHRETSGDWAGAVAAWAAAVRLAPDDERLRRRLGQAQHKRDAGELLVSGKDALHRGDWAAALAVATRLLTSDPGNAEAGALQELARREQRRAQQYQTAEQLESAGNWGAAAKAWRELEQESTGYRDVSSRLENAMAQEKRRADRMNRLSQLFAAGAAAEQESRWADAYSAWSAALALTPNDAQLAARRERARAARDAQVAQQAAAVAASPALKKTADAGQTQILPKDQRATSPLPVHDSAAPAGAAIAGIPEPTRAAPVAATPLWRRPILLIPVAVLMLLLCIGVPALAFRGLLLPGDPTPTVTPEPPATIPPEQAATVPGEAVETAVSSTATSTIAPPATETSAPTITLEPSVEPSETPESPTGTATAPSPTATLPSPTATNPPPSATSPPTATAVPPSATAAPPSATAPPPATSTAPPPADTATAPPPPATSTAPPPPETATAPPPPP